MNNNPKVWGIGAMWGRQDVSNQFLVNNVAAIGWQQSEAPALYEMQKDISVGDIIYIKSFSIRGRLLRIKGIGKVTDTSLTSCTALNCDNCFKVDWLCKPVGNQYGFINISREEMKYNVYNNTLYREYNIDIINDIMFKLHENDIQATERSCMKNTK